MRPFAPKERLFPSRRNMIFGTWDVYSCQTQVHREQAVQEGSVEEGATELSLRESDKPADTWAKCPGLCSGQNRERELRRKGGVIWNPREVT